LFCPNFDEDVTGVFWLKTPVLQKENMRFWRKNKVFGGWLNWHLDIG